MKTTHIYAVLEISAAAFADVRARLESAGALGDYLDKDSDEGAALIVFGAVALKALPASEPPVLPLEERPLVELLEVQVYDAPSLNPVVKTLLELPPWQRVKESNAPMLEKEITGILIGMLCMAAHFPEGFAIEKSSSRMDHLRPEALVQASAEIKNLILLCGGKLPKAKAEGRMQKAEGGAA